ncbi:MAG: tetratricopeptide repeat protein [Anaerolineales bacterium]
MNDETKTGLPFPVLPGGTVTFLFTDIEGSTKLLKQLRDQYSTLLDEHREILRDAFLKWNGHEVDSRGEEFFVAFPRATDAVAAAVHAQRELATHTWPEAVDVRVRIGLHTGEPWVAEEGYVGIDVHRAARIANVGHGGQVLLSETTAALVIDELPEGVSLLDLGRHRLKDVRRTEQIRQLVIDGLSADFPPLKSLEALPPDTPGEKRRHNLPAELTPFIGRETELVEIGDLLRDPSIRLLTLVGVGGMGKTRLSLHAAAELVEEFPDGVWLVEFAQLRDPELVPQHAAAVFGVSAQEAEEGRDVGDVLTSYLRDKNLLMLLDNCEHLIEACAGLAENLLRECPEVQLFATSRENLGIPGEKSFVVSSMEVPPETSLPQELETYEATRFFVDRALAALPNFQPTSDNSASIANICRRLDGVPLAIELAAVRVKILAPEQIEDLLQDRFQLLTGGSRTALERHQTLRATMDWSFDLLTEPEQYLLTRLSVFAGGWTLEDAEGLIQSDLGTIINILDFLSNLVDKSLVIVDHKHGLVRYGMLETVRQFTAELLTASGNADESRQRHASLFIKLAEEADPKIRGADQSEWLEILSDEHENLRAALGWSIASDRANDAARLVGALGWFWFLRGYWEEAWKWLTMSLDMVSDPEPRLRAKALYRAGGLEVIRGNIIGPPELIKEALEICTDIGDEEGMAWCLNLLGQATTFDRQDLEEGYANLTKSIELFQSLGDEWGVAWSTRYLGQIAEIEEDFERSIALQEEALQRFEDLGDIWNVAHSLFLLGGTLRDHGDYQEAKKVYLESLSKCELVEDNVMAAHALMGLGMVALEMEHYREADEHLRDALEVMQRIGDDNCASRITGDLARVAQHDGDHDQAAEFLRGSLVAAAKLGRNDRIATFLARFAALAEIAGNNERAARLLGAALTSRSGSKTVLSPLLREEFEGHAVLTREVMGNEEFERMYAEGAAMSLDEATAYALGEIRDP